MLALYANAGLSVAAALSVSFAASSPRGGAKSVKKACHCEERSDAAIRIPMMI